MNRFYVRDDSFYGAPNGGRLALWTVIDRQTGRAAVRSSFVTRAGARESARVLNGRHVAERERLFAAGDSALANYMRGVSS
jgi:hypothetical protein